MYITFLIGNGFDRNLGLDTTYSDFIKVYKKSEAKTQTLKEFRSYIDENEELWSSAELAFGQYTNQFGEGEAEKFTECQIDFCESLAEYLKAQEARIDFAAARDSIITAFPRLNNFITPFPSQERAGLSAVYKNHISEEIVFNFICYNYTQTLDKCISTISQKSKVIGLHNNGALKINHIIGEICHVHGTVDKEMVFGVNDEMQILNSKIFNCENGDLFKNLLIKKQANASYMENTDAKAARILDKSSIIYIYGMSIGDTDNLWWNRICTWLSASNSNHLIIQKYEPPKKRTIPIQYQLFEREQRQEFMTHSTLTPEKRRGIEMRIHITGDNIFENIHNIASMPVQKKSEGTEQAAAIV